VKTAKELLLVNWGKARTNIANIAFNVIMRCLSWTHLMNWSFKLKTHLIFCGECKIKATKVVKKVCYAKKIQNYIRNGTFLKLFPVDLPQSEATEFAAEREWQIFFGLMKYYS
jgi:hypothetical protein